MLKPKKVNMSRTNFKELIRIQVYILVTKKKWNPGMGLYVFMERNGIHIIDLNKTVSMLDQCHLMKQIRSGKNIFLCHKETTKSIVSEYENP